MNHEMQSKVYQATPVEDDAKLYELAVKMKQLATEIKNTNRDHDIYIADTSGDLADTVLEFLKVSGWSR